MAKCIRCSGEIPSQDNRKICRDCMGNWRKMRETNYAYCEKTIGNMTNEQFAPFQKEMKRLENIWRRNKEKWAKIVCDSFVCDSCGETFINEIDLEAHKFNSTCEKITA